MSDEDEKKVLVQAYKQAMREFLDEQKDGAYKTIGQWAFNSIATLVALAVLWFILKMNGWNHT